VAHPSGLLRPYPNPTLRVPIFSALFAGRVGSQIVRIPIPSSKTPFATGTLGGTEGTIFQSPCRLIGSNCLVLVGRTKSVRLISSCRLEFWVVY